MKFSYSAVWDDTARLLRTHASLISAIAGALIALPSLVTAYLLPQPEPVAGRLVSDYLAYVDRNWPWLLLGSLAQMIGALAILQLILDHARRPTVGAALGTALTLLPGYFAASLIGTAAMGVGALFFVLPAVYIFGRLATLGPVVAAEGRRNPIDALRRTLATTSGHGWVIAGLILLVALAGVLVILVLTWTVGSLLFLVGGKTLGAFLVLVLGAFTEAALATVLVVLYAAIYRRLASAD